MVQNSKTLVTKEQNDRHKKILTALMRQEDNRRCADCGSRGPTWASVNLGVFMCLQCSGIHRSLGVHISKVRSANLDTWLPEQVEFVQCMGNKKANKYWEARILSNFKRPAENDAQGLNHFIREKYMDRRYASRDYEDPPCIENYLRHPFLRKWAEENPVEDDTKSVTSETSVKSGPPKASPAEGGRPKIQIGTHRRAASSGSVAQQPPVATFDLLSLDDNPTTAPPAVHSVADAPPASTPATDFFDAPAQSTAPAPKAEGNSHSDDWAAFSEAPVQVFAENQWDAFADATPATQSGDPFAASEFMSTAKSTEQPAAPDLAASNAKKPVKSTDEILKLFNAPPQNTFAAATPNLYMPYTAGGVQAQQPQISSAYATQMYMAQAQQAVYVMPTMQGYAAVPNMGMMYAANGQAAIHGQATQFPHAHSSPNFTATAPLSAPAQASKTSVLDDLAVFK